MLLEIVIVLLCVFIFCRLTCGRTESAACLLGKTALVTGGNDGIGFQVCLNLASRGCRVIIADKDDSTVSRGKIIEATGNSNIVSKIFDLTSFKSIRSLAKDINETEERLDILINNAGVGSLPPTITEDGHNAVQQINHYGGFLFTHLLIGLLKKSAPSRIIFTSSPAAIISFRPDRQLLGTKFRDDPFNKCLVYGNTKLATIVIADVLAEKLKGTGVTVNTASPGWVRTGLWNKCKTTGDMKTFVGVNVVKVWGYIVGKSPWEGAQTTTHLAVARDLEKVSGKLFLDCGPATKPPQIWTDWSKLCCTRGATSETSKESLGERIWRISEEGCKLQPDERI